MSSEPIVSIILIGFNDEARIGRALASLTNQTLKNIEILVVDDASTDDTGAVVQSHADSRVHYYRLSENSGGCSGPRNFGLAHARAPYVMFCDSDDELPRQAAALLWEAAERTGADVTCGLATRIDVHTGEAKPWRPELHAREQVVSSCEQLPDLLYDTISVNKLYRTEFLRDYGIEFPPGLLFEDQLFTLEVFLAAQRICVIPHQVYRWYVDANAEEQSITQGRSQRRNIEDRLTINRRMDQVLLDRPDLARAKAIKFLRHEGYLYLATALTMEDPGTILDPLRQYLETVPTEAFFQVRPMVRIALAEVMMGNFAAACAAMRFEKWASVIDGEILDDLFMPSGHQPVSELRGRSMDEWLDVSPLVLGQVPWSQRRYLHLWSSGATVTTVDYLASDPLHEISALCVLADGQGRARATRPMEVAQREGNRITWRPAGQWSAAGAPLSRSQRGTVQLWLSRDGVVNRSIVRSADSSLRHELEWRPRSEWHGPTSITIAGGARAAVQWKPEGQAQTLSSGLRSLRRRQGRSYVSEGDPQPMIDLVREVPGDRMIIAVLPATSPLRTDVPLDLARWGNPDWYLLVGGSHSVPTSTRGFARDVRMVDEATVIDLADVVVTDDPDVIARAHAGSVRVIRYRPRLGAERYALPPLSGRFASELCESEDELLRRMHDLLREGRASCA